MSQVKITANDQGQIIVPSQNTEGWGYVRLEQEKVVRDNGFINRRKVSALERADLETLKAVYGNKKEGQIMPGKIYTVESTEKPYDSAEPKINPTTGQVLTHNGLEIYRESFYTEDMSKQDQLLPHDTVSETVEAENKEEAEMSIS